MKSKILLNKVALLLTAFLVSVSAFAQTNEDTTIPDDEVVVGYGTMTRKELTSSVASVTSDKLGERASAMNVMQSMQGKLAGVNVLSTSGRPGGQLSVRVRGAGSVNASCEPLYIVDGAVGVDPTVINTNDIESIDVLKDAAATALYGAMGANGVVIITTKTGKKGGSSVTFSTQTGAGMLARKMDGTKYDTDWQDEAYRKALVTTNNVSFTSNVDNTSVYSNIGYQDVQGIMTGTDARQYTGMINVNSQFTKWLDAQFSANVSRRQDALAPESEMYNDAACSAISMFPFVPVMSFDGNIDNPLKIMDMYHSTTNTNQVLLNAGLTFHIAKGLDLNVKGNFNKKQYTNNYFVEYGLKGFTDDENHARVTNNTYTRWSNEDYLTYNNVFFDGALKSHFTLGVSWYYYNVEGAVSEAKGIPEELFQYHNLSTGTNPIHSSSSYYHSNTNSYYFRTSQVLLGRYMLGFAIRSDKTSYFDVNTKQGLFPTVSAAWDVAAEPWFASAKNVVDQLKIRASYGLVGNSAFETLMTFEHAAEQTFDWEKAKQFDAGLDLVFWNGRLNVIADYYVKNSENLLISDVNVGTLTNKGFELTINSRVIDNRNFKWDLDAIWATNKIISDSKVDEFIKYIDVDGKFAGNVLPKGEASLVNTFFFDGFTFSVDLGAMYGHSIANYGAADFLRMRNISLAYDFKHKLLKANNVIKGLILGANVENACIFTNYSGVDPEGGVYPKPMAVTGNIKITF